MQVSIRACHFNFYITQTTQACCNRRHIIRNNRRVGHQANICRQSLAVGFDKWTEIVRTDLFLAFNHKLDIAVQGIIFHHHLKRLDVHIHLPLVVTCTACEYRAFRMQFGLFNHRFEGWRSPQIQRVGWLHIVMSIDQYSRQFFIYNLLTIHNRMPRRRANLHIICTRSHKRITHKLGSTCHICRKR